MRSAWERVAGRTAGARRVLLLAPLVRRAASALTGPERRLFLDNDSATFQVLDVLCRDSDDAGMLGHNRDQAELCMLLFGRTLGGSSILVLVGGLPARFHVRLPPRHRAQGVGRPTLPASLRPAQERVKELLSRVRGATVQAEALTPFGCYEHGRTEIFFAVTCPCEGGARYAQKLLRESGEDYEIVAPGRTYLRETALLAELGFEFSALLRLDQPSVSWLRRGPHRRSTCDVEVHLKATAVAGGRLRMAENQLVSAPLVVASVDIEVPPTPLPPRAPSPRTHRRRLQAISPSGGFPTASKPEDKIVNIGLVLATQGRPETETLVLCLDEAGTGWGAAPRGRFETFSSERALLERYSCLLRSYDVDMVIGCLLAPPTPLPRLLDGVTGWQVQPPRVRPAVHLGARRAGGVPRADPVQPDAGAGRRAPRADALLLGPRRQHDARHRGRRPADHRPLHANQGGVQAAVLLPRRR